MRIDRAISDVGEAQVRLTGELHELSQRHAAEADVHHTAVVLATGCTMHLAALRPAAARYGAPFTSGDATASPAVAEASQRSAASRSEPTGAVQLKDLRHAYLTAQAAEVDWVMLLQAAKAARDSDLITVATEGEDHARRCGSWLRTRIKESAAQVLASG